MFRTASFLALFGSMMLPLAAQEPKVKTVPAPYTSPASGTEMYRAYCANCHGLKGMGDGPIATDLKVAVPDLTQLAKQNKGVFPEARVAQVIRGEVGARTHGALDMPVWGPVFHSFNGRNDTVVHQRVSNLTKFIGTLQAK